MRGFLHPSVKNQPTETQAKFAALSRHRRTQLAKTANTTLLKADQWAKGGAATADVGDALESALKALGAPKKK